MCILYYINFLFVFAYSSGSYWRTQSGMFWCCIVDFYWRIKRHAVSLSLPRRLYRPVVSVCWFTYLPVIKIRPNQTSVNEFSEIFGMVKSWDSVNLLDFARYLSSTLLRSVNFSLNIWRWWLMMMMMIDDDDWWWWLMMMMIDDDDESGSKMIRLFVLWNKTMLCCSLGVSTIVCQQNERWVWFIL